MFEFDGTPHLREFYNGVEGIINYRIRDKIKNKFCLEYKDGLDNYKGIILIRIDHRQINDIDEWVKLGIKNEKKGKTGIYTSDDEIIYNKKYITSTDRETIIKELIFIYEKLGWNKNSAYYELLEM